MKKLSNNQAVITLRVVAALAGIMCTAVSSLFASSWTGMICIAMLGSITISLVDECIKLPKL